MFVMIHAVVYAFAFLLASTVALPVLQNKRDVVNPPIISPDGTTVWHVGDKQTVTWDTSSLPPPANITNTQGKVVLGFLTPDSENLMIDTPLAQGFSILDGRVDITVPDVPQRTNYIIALMGDSGNISPEFTILGGSSPSASVPATPSSTLASPSLPSATPSPPIAPKPSSTPLEATPSSAPVASSAPVVSPASSPASTPSAPPSAVAASIPSSSSSSVSPSPTAAGLTNGAWSSKHLHFSSIALTASALVALIMI